MQREGSILAAPQKPVHAFRLTVDGHARTPQELQPGDEVVGTMAAEGALLRVTFTTEDGNSASLKEVRLDDYNNMVNDKAMTLIIRDPLISPRHRRFNLPSDNTGLEVPHVVRKLIGQALPF